MSLPWREWIVDMREFITGDQYELKETCVDFLLSQHFGLYIVESILRVNVLGLRDRPKDGLNDMKSKKLA